MSRLRGRGRGRASWREGVRRKRETGELRIKSTLSPFARVYIRRALIICHPSSDSRPLGLGVRQAISPWPSLSECSRYLPCRIHAARQSSAQHKIGCATRWRARPVEPHAIFHHRSCQKRSRAWSSMVHTHKLRPELDIRAEYPHTTCFRAWQNTAAARAGSRTDRNRGSRGFVLSDQGGRRHIELIKTPCCVHVAE